MSILGQILATTAQPQTKGQEKLPGAASGTSLPASSASRALSFAKALPASSAAVTPEAGTLVRGEVIDLRPNQVIVQLENGATLSARLEGTIALYIGQKADFYVSQTNDSLITLKLAPETAKENPVIEKVLQAAGLQKSERTVAIVTELLAHQQPVTENNIRHYLMLTAKHPEFPVKDLVLMELHQIPVSEETVARFSEYRSDSHRLLTQGTTLLAAITEQIASLPDATEQKAFVSQLQEILHSGTEAGQTIPSDAENRTEVDSLFRQTSPETANMPETTSEDAILSEPYSTERVVTFQNDMSNNNIKNDSSTALPQAVLKTDHRPLPELFFDLKQEFLNSFLLSPEEIAESDRVADYYEHISKQLTSLEELAEKLKKSAGGEAAQTSTRQLRSNLSFMELINQVFPYVQLPLQLKEHPAHGELYVYEKKRTLSGSGSLSALLHLELEALGTTDIFLTLTGNSVSARFTLADETAKQLIVQELPSLQEALEVKGYSLHTEVTLREDKTEDASLLEQFLEEHSPSGMSRYTFDIRA
ncbi:MAG: flagellar hook-length control protein FliK [Lachnospiraceae bacterium]